MLNTSDLGSYSKLFLRDIAPVDFHPSVTCILVLFPTAGLFIRLVLRDCWEYVRISRLFTHLCFICDILLWILYLSHFGIFNLLCTKSSKSLCSSTVSSLCVSGKYSISTVLACVGIPHRCGSFHCLLPCGLGNSNLLIYNLYISSERGSKLSNALINLSNSSKLGKPRSRGVIRPAISIG